MSLRPLHCRSYLQESAVNGRESITRVPREDSAVSAGPTCKKPPKSFTLCSREDRPKPGTNRPDPLPGPTPSSVTHRRRVLGARSITIEAEEAWA